MAAHHVKLEDADGHASPAPVAAAAGAAPDAGAAHGKAHPTSFTVKFPRGGPTYEVHVPFAESVCGIAVDAWKRAARPPQRRSRV
jgi:hypothetical protein